MRTVTARTTGRRPVWDVVASAAVGAWQAFTGWASGFSATRAVFARPVEAAAAPPPVIASSRRYLNRPVLVAADLSVLEGPAVGIVTLPVELHWSGSDQPVYDLADPKRVSAMYRVVLREARRPDQLAAYLNSALLAANWADIARRLPDEVRAAWQDVHPGLAGMPAAARAA